MEILKEMPRRDPLYGTFELTVRCNLKCKMCLFRHDDSENTEIMAKEKTAEEWVDMARQVAEAGTMNLLITGGEPMLRPDFCEIYEGIYKQGFVITLYTNATLVTHKVMEMLKKYPPHKIGVTLYGASEETYKKVCGSEKAFSKVMHGIKSLLELPSIIEFRTTIINDNFKDLDNMKLVLDNLLGGDCVLTHASQVFKPVRGGSCDVDSCRLSPDDSIKLLLNRNIEKIKRDAKNKGLNPDKFKIVDNKIEIKDKVKTDELTPTLFGCNAGMDSYTISWDGLLLGCQLLGNFYTMPFEESFKYAWNKYPLNINLPENNLTCEKCKYKKKCSSCYAVRYAESGELNGFTKYMCDYTKSFINNINKVKERGVL